MEVYKLRVRPKVEWDKLMEQTRELFPKFGELAAKKYIDYEDTLMVGEIIRKYKRTDDCFELSMWKLNSELGKEFTPIYSEGNNYKNLYYWEVLASPGKTAYQIVLARTAINGMRSLESEWDSPFYYWTPEKVQEAVRRLSSTGRNPRTIAEQRGRIREFCRWARQFDAEVTAAWEKVGTEKAISRFENDINFLSLPTILSRRMGMAARDSTPNQSYAPQLAAYLIFKGANVDDNNDYGLRYIKNSDFHDGVITVTTKLGKRDILLNQQATSLVQKVLLENRGSLSPFLMRTIRKQQVPAPLKRWAINFKLQAMSEQFFGGGKYLSYRMIRRSGRMAWVENMAMSTYGTYNLTPKQVWALLRLNHIAWGEISEDDEITGKLRSRIEREANEWNQYVSSSAFRQSKIG